MKKNKCWQITHFLDPVQSRFYSIIKDGMKYIYSGRTQKEELYDLKSDPEETVDISRNRPELIQMFRDERSRFFGHATE